MLQPVAVSVLQTHTPSVAACGSLFYRPIHLVLQPVAVAVLQTPAAVTVVQGMPALTRHASRQRFLQQHNATVCLFVCVRVCACVRADIVFSFLFC